MTGHHTFTSCPICAHGLNGQQHDGAHDRYRIDCKNCGDHWFTEEAISDSTHLLKDSATRARIAHAVYLRRPNDDITAQQIADMAKMTRLPPALERVNRLVSHMATNLEPGDKLNTNPKTLEAMLGCARPEAVQWVIAQAVAEKLVDEYNPNEIALSVKGWQHFAALERTGAGSRRAFMAMQYAAPQIEALFTQALVPAVKATGFDLLKVNGGHKDTSLIDLRMQVELHTCRFVVCDLSDHNRGAYWEAGFAAGIKRPVFYLCRNEVLKAADNGPHFDTNHYPIIGWDPGDHAPAMQELKAMIRATLPAEAHMSDPPAS